MLYRPCASLDVDWVTPVPAFFTSTFAPPSAAPELSVTVPEIVALTCAFKPVTPIEQRRTMQPRAEMAHFRPLKFEFIYPPKAKETFGQIYIHATRLSSRALCGKNAGTITVQLKSGQGNG